MEPSGSPSEQLISVPVQPQPQIQTIQQFQPVEQVQSQQLIQSQQMIQQQQVQSPQVQNTTSFTIFVWKFFSVISWVLLIITSLEAFIRDQMIYSVHSIISIFDNGHIYIPISNNLKLLQSFLMILLLLAFYNFAYLGLFKGDNKIVDPLFADKAKYHCIPLFLISLINMNAQAFKNLPQSEDEVKGIYTDGLVFTLLALICLGFIYYKMEMDHHDWYIILTIKKGIFSALIVFLWYCFFYYIVLVGSTKQKSDTNLADFFKGTGIAFSLLIGLGSLSFSFIFKDLMAAVTNLLIYIGMVSSFFSIYGKSKEQKKSTGGNADGIIEIIMMAINLIMIGILIFKCNNSLTDNKYSFNLG